MKPVFQVLFGLIVAAAIGALILSFSIDRMVKSNIESTTSEMLDTAVSVDDLAISILGGTGTISGITIHNPEGFSKNPAVNLEQIKLKVDLYSLFSDTVVVKEIYIQKPELFFEQKLRGSNLDALMEKLGSFSLSEIHLIVDYLLVQDGMVAVTSDLGDGKSVKASFSKFEREDIGRKGNNAIEQTMRQILEPIFEKAAREVIEQGVKDKD